MKFNFLLVLFFSFLFSNHITAQSGDEQSLILEKSKAEYLYHFGFDCIDREYPNKLGQVLGDDSYLAPPRKLHPAFYGCYDWHSSVHGHWTLVTLMKAYPDFEHTGDILAKLSNNITKENIQQEIAFFYDEHNKDFQRTYGWAWLLKLDEALREWDHPSALALHQNLSPLTKMLSLKFIEFLDKLNYPIRVGEHTNTAFGMSFAMDYALKYDPALAAKIREKAIEYYFKDENCPVTWEPGGFDFLSPCLIEASLMMKVLDKKEFKKWLKKFMPGFETHPEKYFQPAIVTDASDGKLAHLDGLNFSRAWCLFEIGHAMDNKKMIRLAKQHFSFSYQKMDAGEYAGSHWLASFATYALLKADEQK